MLAEQGCELSPIHDSFGVHANDCDLLRKLYRSLLARLYRENIIDDILSDILGRKVKIDREEFDEFKKKYLKLGFMVVGTKAKFVMVKKPKTIANIAYLNLKD